MYFRGYRLTKKGVFKVHVGGFCQESYYENVTKKFVITLILILILIF